MIARMTRLFMLGKDYKLATPAARGGHLDRETTGRRCESKAVADGSHNLISAAPRILLGSMQSSSSEFAGRDRTELRSHLTNYWKIEAGNVVLIPAMGCAMLWSGDVRPDSAAIAGMVACSLLLVIGAAAWRMALAGLDGDTVTG